MYTCVYIYIYICIYTCIHIYPYISMYITACHAEIIIQYVGIQIVWPRPGLQGDCEAVEETDKNGGGEGGNADTASDIDGGSNRNRNTHRHMHTDNDK